MTTFMLRALLLISGGWSLIGVTVMLKVSVTTAWSLMCRGATMYAEEGKREWRGEKEEESEEKVDKGEEEGGSRGATQAWKVKLSLVVSESSWTYVMPNLSRTS